MHVCTAYHVDRCAVYTTFDIGKGLIMETDKTNCSIYLKI